MNNSIERIFIVVFLAATWTQVWGHKSPDFNDFKNKVLDLPLGQASSFFKRNGAVFQLTSVDDFHLLGSFTGNGHRIHYRYQQFHDGLPIEGAFYTLHAEGERIERGTGIMYPEASVSNADKLREDVAVRKALEAFIGTYEDDGVRMQRMLTMLPEKVSKTLIDRTYPHLSGELRVAYKIQYYDQKLPKRTALFVDAQSGVILYTHQLIQHKSVPGTAQTMYYGEQTIICDSVDVGEYHLFDDTRGDGVYTLDPNGMVWMNDSRAWDYTAQMDEAALDLHFAQEQYYDMMLEDFDWMGIDNKGGAIISTLAEEYFINAFWDGESATFGRGDCNHGPLTTLEVVAHELAHGFTQFTSGLIYSGESGAMNESISDIFGKALEYRVDPQNFDWYIGHSFLLNQYGKFFRSMKDPHERQHPKYLGGEFWLNNADVHVNSSIGNYWFYLLVEGAMGTNEVGYSYDFQGIGMDDALQIVFLTQTAYLFPSATYDDFYTMSVQAAQDLFGVGSVQEGTVEEAWKIVGAPRNVQGGADRDLSITLTFEEEETCLTDEYLPFTIKIKNAGTEAFDPSLFQASMYFNGQFLGWVEDVLEAGEAVEYVFDDVLLIDYYDFEYHLVRLDWSEDQNLRNNVQYAVQENLNPEFLDIEVFAFQSNDLNCASRDATLDIYLQNLSCISVPSGTEAEISYWDLNTNTSLYSEMVSLPEVSGGGFAHVQGVLPKHEVSQQVEVRVNISSDMNLDNNGYTTYIEAYSVIDTAYFEEFNNVSGLEKLFIQNGFNANGYRFDGESYLAFSGDSPEPFFNPCASEAEVFKSNNVMHLSGCITLAHVEHPVLSFDLLKFYNDSIPFPELRNNGCLMSVTWEEGGVPVEHILPFQTEGLIYHHSFSLPANYSGPLVFSAYAHSGVYYMDPEYLEYDVLLLDNVRIDYTLNSVDVTTSTLDVRPNPAGDLIHISYPHDVYPQQLRIWDMSGSVQIEKQGDFESVDISKLRGGCYVLSAVGQDGKMHQSRIVKMR